MILKVGVQQYKVIDVPHGDLSECAGECDSSTNTIKLMEGMAAGPRRHKLLHEALHAINIEMDEETIEFLTCSIEQLLVENKELTYLFID